jgi:predicted amidohydrolase YtcJ
MIAQQPNFLYNLEGRYQSTLDDWRLAHNNSIATPARKFGIHMAFSSDNLPIDPRVGLYAATTRKGPSGTVHGAEEAVTREEALRMYTANGAHLSWEEKTKGTLEAGKLADMVVLEQDPLKVADSDLLTMKIDYTIVGGKVVYKRPEARA